MSTAMQEAKYSSYALLAMALSNLSAILTPNAKGQMPWHSLLH
jgi:hypothetical protein